MLSFLYMQHWVHSVVNNVSKKGGTVKEDVPSGHEALKRWLLVICWCCIKWLGPATEWISWSLPLRFKELAEQRASPLVLHTTVGLCTVCAKRANSVCAPRGVLTEQTRETCWTKSRGRGEDGKHPLRPVYQTWAVLNQFKTLFSTWQTLHIFLISTDLPKLQYMSHNLSNLLSISLIDRLLIDELICVHS